MTEKLNKLLEDGLKPHAAAIAEIAMRGDIAVVLFEPSWGGIDAARVLGRSGSEMVFAINRTRARKHLSGADHITAKWVERREKGVARVFVIMNEGTLLVNYRPGAGWEIEPGSTDKYVLD